MNGRKAEFLIDLEQVKKEKQRRMDKIYNDLYDWMFTYVQAEANLREKVRAKHLFRHKLGIKGEQEMSRMLELHFEHWLLFDYVTVTGSRLLDLFARSKQEKMTKEMLELTGILMLMHLEPFRVKRRENGIYTLKPLFEEKYINASVHLFDPGAAEGDVILARVAPVGFEKKMTGPAIVIDRNNEERITGVLQREYEKGPEHYRRYLKEFGADMLQYTENM